MTAGRPRAATRRALAAAAGVLVLAGGAVAGCGGSGASGGDYRVDAIFDNASFVTPDVDVRIAGAKVGRVTDLSVTPDHKARLELTIDRRFGPFHTDADCTIAPQSLISERFVNCTPGSSDAPVVPDVHGTPTLGLQGTHSPVDIDQVLNTFNLPVRQRLTLLLDGLGVGLTARGDDLNAAIRRAAPALGATHDTLAILDADRARLQHLVTASDTVLRSLAAGRDRAAAFVRAAGVVAQTSGDRQRQLAAAVRDLPALLGQARPSLDRLTRFAGVATPFAADLRRSAPGLRDLVTQLAPFAARATPTLTRLGVTSRRTTAALPDIAPQVRRLRRFTAAAGPTARLLAELFTSFRARGTLEALQGFTYYAAAAVARFDKNSHYLPAYLLPSACILYARTPTPGCDAHFEASRGAILAAARRRAARRAPAARKPAARGPATAPKAPATPSAPGVPSLPAVPALPGVPKLPPAVGQVPQALQGLLHALGGGGGGGGGGTGRGAGATPGPPAQNAQDLLDYLLG
ncbi:MlaD family protein [Paraconexibacter antarcticus]|uniref:MlaD family protein n=1 Tax=Paraconexibacter antarcticus TaxID=2949664 RepID=A0ABY5DSX0_9ACTN|nr:MlaD family protein [Paraconexibacter antarcticus]UTI65120.1 MlaD family protein [Paraconexibacter antarcticus]